MTLVEKIYSRDGLILYCSVHLQIILSGNRQILGIIVVYLGYCRLYTGLEICVVIIKGIIRSFYVLYLDW